MSMDSAAVGVLGPALTAVQGLTSAGIFAGIYSWCAKVEANQSPENRKFVADWLHRISKYSDPRWDEFYRGLFVGLFGARHLSFKCARRSLLLTTAVLTVALSFWWTRNSDALSGAFKNSFGFRFLLNGFSILLPISAAVDYMTLWKTRIILMNFYKLSKLLPASGIVVIDAIITVVLLIVMWLIALVLVFALGDGLAECAENLVIGFADFSPATVFPGGLFVVCALMTSAWIWLYVVTAGVIRFFQLAQPLMTALPKVIDVDHHPVRSIGLIIASLSAGSFALVCWI